MKRLAVALLALALLAAPLAAEAQPAEKVARNPRSTSGSSSPASASWSGTTPCGGIFLNLQPVVGALLGVWLLHEPLTPFTVAGGALIVGGLWLTVTARAR